MREIFEHLQPLPYDSVAFAAVHVHDKAHPASVVLVGRVVESLGGR